MPWMIPAAIAGGAVIGGIGSYFGAKQGADAQRDAARMQQDAANRALGLQRDMFDQSRADLAPFRSLGLGALQDYYRRVSAGGDDADLKRIQAEQTASFNTQMAGRGLLGSSASVKGLSDLGAKIAEAREQRYYDRMQPLLGLGSGTSGQLAQSAMGYGREAGNTLQGGAQAAGGLFAGAGQTSGMGLAGGLGALGSGLGTAGSLYGLYGRGNPGAGGGGERTIGDQFGDPYAPPAPSGGGGRWTVSNE